MTIKIISRANAAEKTRAMFNGGDSDADIIECIYTFYPDANAIVAEKKRFLVLADERDEFDYLMDGGANGDHITL